MVKFLSCGRPVIFEYTDVLEAAVSFQVLHALCSKQKKLLDFAVLRIPQVAIMPGILDQHLMGPDRLHSVVDSVPPSRRLAFDTVEGARMHDRARGPGRTLQPRGTGDELQRLGGVGTEPAA